MPAAIEITNLYKSFGKVPALIDENLTVEEGEFFGFIGPNGSGKSTTIRLLLNYYRPTRGTAKVYGLDSVRDSIKIRSLTGYVPSEVDFYGDMKAGELIRYAAKLRRWRAKQKMEELCDLFEVDTEQYMGKMSLGNRKKVLLVMSLMHSPRLLLLDEPTLGLDSLTKRRLKDYLITENERGTTIFFCSHDMAEVQELCGRMGIIRNGTILEVADVNAISASDCRRISLKTEEDMTPLFSLFHIGVIQHTMDDYLHFSYTGDINLLLQALQNYRLDDLQISLPSLEDAMVRYYEKKLDKEDKEFERANSPAGFA